MATLKTRIHGREVTSEDNGTTWNYRSLSTGELLRAWSLGAVATFMRHGV